MTEDKLKTHDQFLIDQKVIPNPDREIRNEKLVKTTRKLAKNAALLTLALSALDGTSLDSPIPEQIKFQGLRAYARMNSLELSTKFVDHFLYGNGEELNITEDFANFLKTDAQTEFPTFQTEGIVAEMTTQQVYERYLQNAFSIGVQGSDAKDKSVFIRTLNESGEEIYHTSGELPSLIGENIRIFRIDEIMGDDPFYSLGNFTIDVQGKLSGVDENGNAILEDAGFGITDKYDWQRGMDLNAETSISTIIEGSPLEGILPEQIKEIKLSVTDDEGATLVESGVAHPFKITANVHFDHPIIVPTNNVALPEN